MEGIYKHSKDCFDVFISDRNIDDNDEFLGKTLKYLQEHGFLVNLKGFDKYGRPLVEINGIVHTADKNCACCTVERFINVKTNLSLKENTERYNKITSYIQ